MQTYLLTEVFPLDQAKPARFTLAPVDEDTDLTGQYQAKGFKLHSPTHWEMVKTTRTTRTWLHQYTLTEAEVEALRARLSEAYKFSTDAARFAALRYSR
jgi:hypothetical protein